MSSQNASELHTIEKAVVVDMQRVLNKTKPVLQASLLVSVFALVATFIAIVISVFGIIAFAKQKKLDESVKMDLYRLCEPLRNKLVELPPSIQRLKTTAEAEERRRHHLPT